MDASHVHLLVNHFPISLTVVGAVAALAALALRRTPLWRYATATLVLAGLTAVPSFFTGEAAEEVMEGKWFVSEDAIHGHEEAGELALWVLLAMAAVNAYVWWRETRRAGESLPNWLKGVVVASALAGLASVAYTGVQGAKIVHDSAALEIVPADFAKPTPLPAPTPSPTR